MDSSRRFLTCVALVVCFFLCSAAFGSLCAVIIKGDAAKERIEQYKQQNETLNAELCDVMNMRAAEIQTGFLVIQDYLEYNPLAQNDSIVGNAAKPLFVRLSRIIDIEMGKVKIIP